MVNNNNAPDTYVASTLRDVAEFFGVQEQTVRQWRMRADPMPGEPGRWDLSRITLWRIQCEWAKHRHARHDRPQPMTPPVRTSHDPGDA